MTVALERRGARCGDAAVVRGWMRGGCRHRGHRDERGHRVRRIVVRAANYWRRGGLCLGYSLFDCQSEAQFLASPRKCNWLEVMRTNDKYARISHRRAGTNSGLHAWQFSPLLRPLRSFRRLHVLPRPRIGARITRRPRPRRIPTGRFQFRKDIRVRRRSTRERDRGRAPSR